MRACACVPLSLGFKGLVSCSDFVPMYTLKIFLVVGCLRKWFSRSVCVASLLVFGVVLKVCPQGCGSVKPDTAPQGVELNLYLSFLTCAVSFSRLLVFSAVAFFSAVALLPFFEDINNLCNIDGKLRIQKWSSLGDDDVNIAVREHMFQVVDLQQTIGGLVVSLIEENGPGASQVAKVKTRNHDTSRSACNSGTVSSSLAFQNGFLIVSATCYDTLRALIEKNIICCY